MNAVTQLEEKVREARQAVARSAEIQVEELLREWTDWAREVARQVFTAGTEVSLQLDDQQVATLKSDVENAIADGGREMSAALRRVYAPDSTTGFATEFDFREPTNRLMSDATRPLHTLLRGRGYQVGGSSLQFEVRKDDFPERKNHTLASHVVAVRLLATAKQSLQAAQTNAAQQELSARWDRM
jgi:hypothetical protein